MRGRRASSAASNEVVWEEQGMRARQLQVKAKHGAHGLLGMLLLLRRRLLLPAPMHWLLHTCFQA
jgi:hypothetical protein